MRSRIETSILRLLLLAILTLVSSAYAVAQESFDFAHDVMPILTSRCAECHSNGVYQGDLSLDTREKLMGSGAVDSGSRNDSELFVRIASNDPDTRMPPEGDPLTALQIEAIGKWIDEGVDWPTELSLKKHMFKRSLVLPKIELPPDAANPVDHVLEIYFHENDVSYPRMLSDQQFLRRAKLDLLGLLPTVEEIDAFHSLDDPDKHAKLIDDLLANDRDFADHWISFWNDLLRNDYAGTGYIDGGRQQITTWLHRSLMENKPYDRFVRELVSPDAESGGFIKGIKWRGEVNASQIQPLQFSQNISQVFLGINMKCASCHDSFIDDWKLRDAYGLAAITSDEPLQLHRCDVPTGEFATSKFVFPSIGKIDQNMPRAERLKKLAEMMTSGKNGRFSRTIVNRLWQRMTGRGLVHPVDVMAGEAWSEKILNLLASDLVANGFDLKRTMRLIATSRIYRAASVTDDPGLGDEFIFRGVQPKRLTAEQFVDAVWQLTGAGPTGMIAEIEMDQDDEKSQPKLVRASLVHSDALMRSLGRPNREQVVTTRPADLSTLQALDLSNGELLTGWLKTGAKKWIAVNEQNQWTNQQLVTRIFVAALSREPNDSEIELLLPEGQSDIRTSVEDLLWIIVMLPEFQFVR